jgi:uncharacterized protein YdeI (BOF family)
MARIIISELYTSSDKNLFTELEPLKVKSVTGGYDYGYGYGGGYNTPNTARTTSTIRQSVSNTLDQVDNLLGNLRIQIDKEMYNLQNQVNQQTTGSA